MKLKSLPISFKLALGFTLITFMTIGIAIYSIVALKNQREFLGKMFHHPYTVSNTLKGLQIDIQEMSLTAHNMLNIQDKAKLKMIQEKVYSYDDGIYKKFEIIKDKYLGPKEEINQLIYQYQQLKIIRAEFIRLINDDKPIEARTFMLEVGVVYKAQLNKAVKVLSNFADNKANEFFHNAEDTEKSTIFYLSVSLVIATILSLVIGVYTIRRVVSPITELVDTTNKIIDGEIAFETSARVKHLLRRDDEIGKLFNSFDKLMKYLLLPYQNIISNKRPLVEKTLEVQRLLNSFDKYIIASKTDVRGNIIYVSRAFIKNSGYSKEELITHSHNVTRHPDMSKEFYRELWKTIKKGKVWTGEIKNKKKDGTFFWTRTVISPDYDTNRVIIGYNAISENLTISKAYEELSLTLEERVKSEIEKNEKKTAFIIQQSRLAQMGEMISMIAHQWRQPLASISAISSTLMLDVIMQNYKEEFFQERLEAIGELSQHLSSTIDDFRNFFKEDKQKENILLDTIINSCIHVIDTSLKNKGIKLILETDESIVLSTFSNELKQVILNILKNAEDALVEKNISDGIIIIKTIKEASNAIITIEDNAGGLPDEIVDKVFDPYFSTKTQKDGTGLGLYMSKTIIEDHCEGEISLQNSTIGASFVIKLPLSDTKELS
ncbi:PAS domain-containing protein [Sulfurimonas aquatica]|uniref:histidine kinase n=1 Tax=Sulfurimonas aquatica TaxID=2672570 RepID=A0A975B0M6_9BACT|nr:sensor histidine kinase [Sulfurimonas aquatica]QSZ42029.1 PAS domain-containing protein [Sulfurimonas aquatica]